MRKSFLNTAGLALAAGIYAGGEDYAANAQEMPELPASPEASEPDIDNNDLDASLTREQAADILEALDDIRTRMENATTAEDVEDIENRLDELENSTSARLEMLEDNQPQNPVARWLTRYGPYATAAALGIALFQVGAGFFAARRMNRFEGQVTNFVKDMNEYRAGIREFVDDMEERVKTFIRRMEDVSLQSKYNEQLETAATLINRTSRDLANDVEKDERIGDFPEILPYLTDVWKVRANR